jgi:uncharacterized OsmC-like protein
MSRFSQLIKTKSFWIGASTVVAAGTGYATGNTAPMESLLAGLFGCAVVTLRDAMLKGGRVDNVAAGPPAS